MGLFYFKPEFGLTGVTGPSGHLPVVMTWSDTGLESVDLTVLVLVKLETLTPTKFAAVWICYTLCYCSIFIFYVNSCQWWVACYARQLVWCVWLGDSNSESDLYKPITKMLWQRL